MKDIQSLLLAPDSTALEALKVIDRGAAQIALVVNEQQYLLGTLTDGDIRRALLNGETLDSPVERLMNRHFHSVGSSEDLDAALLLMRQKFLRHIPVIDANGRVEQLLLLQEFLASPELSNAVVIMAGGKGTRLRPHTENCPKPMLPVGDIPMLEILLRQCIDSGFKQFYFSVNYLKEQIINYFQDGSAWGVSINYLIEDQPLGTAGSLQLLPNNLSAPFLVLNGDVLTRLNLTQLLSYHHEHKAKATLCVREHEINVPFGVVEINGVELASFAEKPTYRNLVNAGVYVIDPVLLHLLSDQQHTDMPGLLLAAQQAGHLVAVCPIHEYWLDVGNSNALKLARKEWID